MCSIRPRRTVVTFSSTVVWLGVLACISALAGPNADTTMPLAAWDPAPFTHCDVPACSPTWPHHVNMPLGSQPFVTVYVRHYDQITGVQTAFDWGAWTFVSGLWDCQSNQVNGTTPSTPGGPVAGTIATVFDCISGGETEQIGAIAFIASAPGCLTQIDSDYPNGTHVIGCGGEVDSIRPENRGRICVDQGGYDACEPAATAVEPVSWGRIKDQYQ